MAAKKGSRALKGVVATKNTGTKGAVGSVSKKSKPAAKSEKPARSAKVANPAKTDKATVPKAAKAEVAPVIVSVEKAKKALAKVKEVKESVVVAATGPLAQKWNALFKKSDAIESKPYNMKQIYNEKTAIIHKVLGWGYILANRNDRLEVLFKDGIKYLISNYK